MNVIDNMMNSKQVLRLSQDVLVHRFGNRMHKIMELQLLQTCLFPEKVYFAKDHI